MNGLETAGVFFCIIVCTMFIWAIAYLVCGGSAIDDDERTLGASLLTIFVLVIVLAMITTSCIENERKNDEYEKVISEYEERGSE